MPTHELFRAPVDNHHALRLVRADNRASIEFVTDKQVGPVFALPAFEATPEALRNVMPQVAKLLVRVRQVMEDANTVKALAAEFPGVRIEDYSFAQTPTGWLEKTLVVTEPGGQKHHIVVTHDGTVSGFSEVREVGIFVDYLRRHILPGLMNHSTEILVQPSLEQLRAIRRAIEALGWEPLEIYVDQYLAEAQIEAKRGDHVVRLLCESIGRTYLERFTIREETPRIKGKRDRTVVRRPGMEFLGRKRFDSRRDGLEAFARYLVANSPNATTSGATAWTAYFLPNGREAMEGAR